VAVDDQSNYPTGVPKTSLSGFTPNVEAIAGYRPDLVVVSDDVKGLVGQLKALSIPTLLEPAPSNLEGAYAEITQLGAASGHTSEAAGLVQTMKGKVAGLLAKLPKRGKPLSYYYELDPTLFTVTSHTFVGSLFTAAGMVDIADRAGNSSDYPQLNAETLLSNNPDLIFLADTKCCGQSAATVSARPGYSTIVAVKNGRVVPLDDDIASRWGPRVTDLLSKIVDAERSVPAP
jgi:iron complex transport system substrate-binding protein